jgi:hypothetical protein
MESLDAPCADTVLAAAAATPTLDDAVLERPPSANAGEAIKAAEVTTQRP